MTEKQALKMKLNIYFMNSYIISIIFCIIVKNNRNFQLSNNLENVFGKIFNSFPSFYFDKTKKITSLLNLC